MNVVVTLTCSGSSTGGGGGGAAMGYSSSNTLPSFSPNGMQAV